MKKNIINLIYTRVQKVYLSFRENLITPSFNSEEEKIASDICTKMIEHSDSILTYSPISSKRIIKNEHFSMFIVIETHTIQIINHVYRYNVYFENNELFSNIKNQFDKKIEQKRELLETEIKNNIQHSLKKILDKLEI